MTSEQKTAIQQAEKQLEKERSERLKNEVYQYLKGELEGIDMIDQKIRKLSEEKRAHEENVKNIKQGNLKALEERRKAYDWTYLVPNNLNAVTTAYCVSSSTNSGNVFYSANVAGAVVTTSSGKTYIF